MYRIARELDEAGFAVVAYLPDDGRTFAAFSIGLSSYGHPELVVTADCEESARCFLLHLEISFVGEDVPYSVLAARKN
ncbi:hypothetical protein AFL94_14365 [Arthrobacter sp. LS16]|nr:hypothetical protein AFL94_14365 [Arthrobacter sp. LS16]